MAKEQKRSNREIRKPKASKPLATPAAAVSFLNKADSSPAKAPKKKG